MVRLICIGICVCVYARRWIWDGLGCFHVTYILFCIFDS